MPKVLRAEWLKAWSGRTWWIMAAVALFIGLLGSSGASSTMSEQIDDGMTDTAAATAEVIRSWFAILLLSMLFGAIFVTREYSSGAISRSVLLSGGRVRLLAAKAIVGTGVGVLFALFTAVLAPLSVWGFFAMFGVEPQWTGEATRTLIGVSSVIALAAPWGVLLGWVIRHQAAAVATLLVVTLFVDETLFAFAPEVGKFTMQLSMGSVYLDGKEEALSVPWALLVIAGWLALAGYAAYWRLAARDVT